ncbi:hypothetical protein Tco_0776216 [Tanacetum coccineum]
MAIQAGWGRGLSEGRDDKEIITILHKAENFDAYSDKKLYPIYDKLFEKEYPYIEKIASGYRHSVVDLLNVHPDPAHSEGILFSCNDNCYPFGSVLDGRTYAIVLMLVIMYQLLPLLFVNVYFTFKCYALWCVLYSLGL